jgi:AraC-like DNA-binding protein
MKLNQYESLLLDEFEEEKFHLPVHSHTYYELIYIVKGKGIHHINDNRLAYKTGDLFALSPDDNHYFDIHSSTRFVFIKFTDSYFSSKKNLYSDDMLMNTPEQFMRNRVLKENVLQLGDDCRSILKNTVNNITAYRGRTDISTSPIIFFQVLSIFGLLKEAMEKMQPGAGSFRFDNSQLIAYIHQNIYFPNKVQTKAVAAHFAIAPSYFSAWFKRNFGFTYRDYVNNLRTRLIEQRIAGRNMPIKQIAHEFGFTDESHLSNYFKKRKHIKPSAFARESQ